MDYPPPYSGLLTPEQEERFWQKVEPTSYECWLWTGATNGKHIGKFYLPDSLGRYTVSAHRLALQLTGTDLTSKDRVRYTCDTLYCVNPDHLYTATKPPKEPKPRGRPPRKLTPAQEQEIQLRYAAGATQRELAEVYGVSHPTIGKTVNERKGQT